MTGVAQRARRWFFEDADGRPRDGAPGALGRLLLDAFYLITGRGRGLRQRREYHRRRELAERAILAEADQDPKLFEPNRCPACGGGEVARRFSNPVGFRFAVCAGDGTVYMDPVPSGATLARLYNDPAETFNYLAAGAEQRTRPSQDTWEDFEALVRMGGHELPAGGRLLDVGCATGAFLVAASSRFEVEGLELSSDTAAVARSLGFPVTTGTLDAVSEDHPFAVLTMLQVIEHIVQPVTLLEKAYRLLVPGGLLYMNTPAVDSASFDYLGPRHVHVSSFGHVSLFTGESLALAGRRAGFEVIAYERCGGLDLELHDLLGYRLAPERFRHRVAFYSPRFLRLCSLLDTLTLGGLRRFLAPQGAPSYHRILLRRPLEAAPAAQTSA